MLRSKSTNQWGVLCLRWLPQATDSGESRSPHHSSRFSSTSSLPSDIAKDQRQGIPWGEMGTYLGSQRGDTLASRGRAWILFFFHCPRQLFHPHLMGSPALCRMLSLCHCWNRIQLSVWSVSVIYPWLLAMLTGNDGSWKAEVSQSCCIGWVQFSPSEPPWPSPILPNNLILNSIHISSFPICCCFTSKYIWPSLQLKQMRVISWHIIIVVLLYHFLLLGCKWLPNSTYVPLAVSINGTILEWLSPPATMLANTIWASMFVMLRLNSHLWYEMTGDFFKKRSNNKQGFLDNEWRELIVHLSCIWISCRAAHACAHMQAHRKETLSCLKSLISDNNRNCCTVNYTQV